MLRIFFFILLLYSVSNSVVRAASCSQNCGGSQGECDTDCMACIGYTAPSTWGTCQDCCQFTSQGSCPTNTPSLCQWDNNSGQCQNGSGNLCVPEVPKQSRSWLIIGFGLLAAVLSGGALGYKRIRNRPS